MKLGLGTVQFGLDYGLSNSRGQTPMSEVKRILNYAYSQGVDVLDTAALYGESERVLGNCVQDGQFFSIITKTSKFLNDTIHREDLDILQETFFQSLNKLQAKSVYALLLHNSDDLFKPNGAWLWDRMSELKQQGLIKKIGISVYSDDQIKQALDRYPIEIIQAPVNVLDQRLLQSGLLKQIANAGIEFHSRSTFLQGLLLMPLNQIPSYFKSLYPLLRGYHEYVEALGLSLQEAAISFAISQTEINKIIIGVTSLLELQQIVQAVQKAQVGIDFSQFAISEEMFLNPSCWKT